MALLESGSDQDGRIFPASGRHFHRQAGARGEFCGQIGEMAAFDAAIAVGLDTTPTPWAWNKRGLGISALFGPLPGSALFYFQRPAPNHLVMRIGFSR